MHTVIAGYLSSMLAFPPLALGMHISQSYIEGQPERVFRIVSGAILGVRGILFCAFRFLSAYRLGFQRGCALIQRSLWPRN